MSSRPCAAAGIETTERWKGDIFVTPSLTYINKKYANLFSSNGRNSNVKKFKSEKSIGKGKPPKSKSARLSRRKIIITQIETFLFLYMSF